VSGAQAAQLCAPGQACRGVPFSSDERVSPPAGTSTYELRVQRTDGGWESRYATIQVAQPANTATITNFSADPMSINPGGSVNLWWTVQGTPGRMALLRNAALIADYMPGASYRDQPPGSNMQVVYELQVWPAGRDTGEPDKRQLAITIGGNPLPPPQTVQLYKDACMSYQNLRAGDTLRISLEAQGGTGYVWYESPDYNGAVLMGSGQPQVGGGGAPGAPESYTFSYTAGPGQTTLTLLYGRQGEGAEAAIEACAITVTVQ
jgi:Chagasin family peptidase inhibitor I42